MNLTQFYADVARAIRRPKEEGNIPSWASEAAFNIEQRSTYSWMKKFGEIALDPIAESPHQIEFPNARVKEFYFIRLYRGIGDGATIYRELQGVSPDQVTSIDLGMPVAYWMDGQEFLWLDARVQEAASIQLHWAEYTDWPTDLDASPAILSRALTLLKAETLINAAVELRDPRMMEIYGAKKQDALNALETAEARLEWKHQGQMRVNVKTY